MSNNSQSILQGHLTTCISCGRIYVLEYKPSDREKYIGAKVKCLRCESMSEKEDMNNKNKWSDTEWE